jgi:predicted Zn-dependent peptidase
MADARVRFEDRVVEQTTSNGIKVIVYERHNSPTVGIHMIFRTGSVDDPVGKGGLAHLFEHMMFKGTETIGTRDFKKEQPILLQIDQLHDRLREISSDSTERQKLMGELKTLEAEESELIISNEFQKIYEKEGAVQDNAYTSADVTRYYVDIASQKLELWAILESDRLKHPVFRQFYSEVEVVKEEHRMRLDDDPENALAERLCAEAFTKHPYGRPPLGTVEELDSVTPQDLRRFYDRYYTPDHLIVAIVGDVNPAQVFALIERYFGDWHTNLSALMDPIPVEPVQTTRRTAILHRPGQPQIMIGFHMPTYPDPDYAAYFAFFHLLGNGPRAILYRHLVNDQQLAGQISCVPFYPGERYPSLFVIRATAAPSHSVNELEGAIMTELEHFTRTPLDYAQVHKVQPAIELELSQTLLSNHAMAARLAYYEAVNGTWRSIVAFHEAMAKLTPADLQRVAKHLFLPSNETVVTLEPPPVAKP